MYLGGVFLIDLFALFRERRNNTLFFVYTFVFLNVYKFIHFKGIDVIDIK